MAYGSGPLVMRDLCHDGPPRVEPIDLGFRFLVMFDNGVSRSLTDLGRKTSRPWAFLIVVVYGVLWFLFQRESFDLHGVATLIVWTMTLFIQRAQHRDTQALHAKLDELLRVEGAAESDLAKIDEKEPEEIEEHRDGTREEGAGRDKV
jgi:low affinity Fe/Cu permease